jgi:hypothetical protein
MGPTAGSSGLALIIGISEGTLGGLVGVQAFFAAADHVAIWGARVKRMKLFGYPHFPSSSGHSGGKRSVPGPLRWPRIHPGCTDPLLKPL